jgi:hypothetical protein
MDVGAVEAPTISEERAMQTITTIGLDIAKSVWHFSDMPLRSLNVRFRE